MPTTTTRGFRIPLADGSDPPNVHTDIRNLGLDIDAMFISVANLAALPAFGKVGRRAFIQSTGDVYVDIGTAWARSGSAQHPYSRYQDILNFSGHWVQGAGGVSVSALHLLAGVVVPDNVDTAREKALIYLDPAEDTITGYTRKLRIRSTISAGSVDPNNVWSIGLYAATLRGGSGLFGVDLGTLVTGSNVIGDGAPNALETSKFVGTDFDVPVAGDYAIGVQTSSVVAPGSAGQISVRLQEHYV